MTTANIAEVLKLAAKLVQYGNGQAMANLPAGAEEPAGTIRTLSDTLYASLATQTTGRSLRLVQRVPNRNGVETVGGRECAENGGSEIRDAASRATAGDE